MNLDIYSDSGSPDAFAFPAGLSQFFEQYQGFGEESEVAQVSDILDIDLSVFQKYNLPESRNIQWLNLNEIISIIENFIAKLKTIPDLYSCMQYGGVTQNALRFELMKAAMENNKAKLDGIVKKWQHTPDSAFPPDFGYIKRGDLKNDLLVLKNILYNIKSSGAKEIRFVYR